MKKITLLAITWILLTLILSTVLAQSASPLPNHEQPSLAVVVMLDDTKTMIEPNSASFNYFPSWPGGTDVEDARADAVRMIAGLLHADQTQTHQLAVYHFYNQEEGEWITNPSGDKFVRLGGTDNTLSLAAFNDLDIALTNRKPSIIREGGGNTQIAMQKVYETLDSKYTGEFADSKIVVLLITDDVPITIFANSPWEGNQSSWATLSEGFRDERHNLNLLPTYQSNSCLHADGHPVFAVFPMGAANWVNADGTIPFKNVNPPTEEITGNYFKEYSEPSQTLLGDPLVYPIAPQFGNKLLLQTAFRNAVEKLLLEVRCLDTELITLNTQGSPQGPFTMSDLYPNGRLMVMGQPNTTVTVFDSTGNMVSSSTPGVRVTSNPDGLQIWSFSHDTFGSTWAGEWSVRLTNPAEVHLERELAGQGVSWLPIDVPTLYPADQSIFYQVGLAVETTPINAVNQSDMFSLQLLLKNKSDGLTQKYPLIPSGRGFSVTIPETEVNTSDYQVEVLITFTKGWGNVIAAGTEYVISAPNSIIHIESPPKMEVLKPGEREGWCNGVSSDGHATQTFRVQLVWGTDVRVIADSASLYSYAQVYLMYSPPKPLDLTRTPYPATQIPLQPNLGDINNPDDDVFEVTLNCDTDLLRGPQKMNIVGRLADQLSFEYTREGVYNAPTATYTSTATATSTATPTATSSPTPQAPIAVPTPLPINPINGLINPLTKPPLRDILIIIFGVVVFIGVYVAFNRYRMRFLPLTFITIEKDGVQGSHQLAMGWRVFIPFMQKYAVYEDAASAFFTIERDNRGAFTCKPTDRAKDIYTTSEDNKMVVVNYAHYRYKIAPYKIFGNVFYTVQRTTEEGNPYNQTESRKRFIPRLSGYIVRDTDYHPQRLFIISRSGSDNTLQVQAEQRLRLNDRIIETGETESIYTSEASILVNEFVFRVRNRRAPANNVLGEIS